MIQQVIFGFIGMIFTLLCSFLIGNLACRIMHTDFKIYKSVIWGVLLILSIFELIAFPCILFRVPFSTMAITYAVIMLFILIFAGYSFISKKEYKLYYFQIHLNYIFVILAILVLAFAFLNGFLYLDVYDDGYYVAISNIAVQQNEIIVNEASVYNGNDLLSAASYRPYIASWEIFIGFLSWLFRVHPAILAHSILPMFLIPLCFLPVYHYSFKLLGNRTVSYIASIFYLVMTFFYGDIICSYLAVGIWTGKGMMYFFSIPLLLSFCLDIYENKETAETWLGILLCIFTGIAFTATGIQMMPLCLFIFLFPYFSYIIFNRKWFRVKKLLGKVIFSLSAEIILLIYSIVYVLNSNGGLNYLSLAPRSWRSVFEIFTGYYFTFFVIIIFLIALAKNSTTWKLFFVGSTATAFIFLLNPIVFRYTQFIVGIPVAQRLYYLLPFVPAAAVGCANATVWIGDKINKKFAETKKKPIGKMGNYAKGLTCSIMISFIVLISGDNMLNVYTAHQNWYMLSQTVIDLADHIEISEKGSYTILLPVLMRPKIRQYTTSADIIMWKQDEYFWIQDAQLKSNIQNFNSLSEIVYNQGMLNEEAMKYLNLFEVDYILTESQLSLSESRFYLSTIIDGKFLYKIKDP